MNNLLTGDIAEAVSCAIDEFLIDIPISRNVDGVYDPSTRDKTGATLDTFTVKGFREQKKKGYKTETVIDDDDALFLMTQNSFALVTGTSGSPVLEPELNDELTFESKVFVIKDIEKDPANATWLVTTKLLA